MEREREKHLRERDTSIGCLPFTPRTKPSTQVCALTGAKPTTFWCTGQHSKQMSHPAWAESNFNPRSYWLTDRGNIRLGSLSCKLRITTVVMC